MTDPDIKFIQTAKAAVDHKDGDAALVLVFNRDRVCGAGETGQWSFATYGKTDHDAGEIALLANGLFKILHHLGSDMDEAIAVGKVAKQAYRDRMIKET